MERRTWLVENNGKPENDLHYMLFTRRYNSLNAECCMSFLNGSTKFQLSSIKDHDFLACHQRAILEKQHSEAVATGISSPARRVEQHMPPNSDIATGLQRMDKKDRDTVEKLNEISFNIALQGLPFTALRS